MRPTMLPTSKSRRTRVPPHGERQTRIASRISQGWDSHLGCAENRGGSGAPFVRGAPPTVWGRSHRQGYAMLEVWGFERCRREKAIEHRLRIPVFAKLQLLEC